MPNWCENDLRITGEIQELEKFKRYAKGKYKILDEEKFIPYPQQFREKDILVAEEEKKLNALPEKERNFLINLNGYSKDGYNSGGYEWCVTHWGTKWGICEPSLEEDGEGLFYTFNTAWSPPLPIIFAMSKKFPLLEFILTYFEGANQFNGIYICKGGVVTRQEEGSYFGERGG